MVRPREAAEVKVGIGSFAGGLAAVFFAALPLQAGVALAQDANVELVDGTDPDVILAVARTFGSAQREIDDYGDPMVTGRIDGFYYSVLFYGCTDNANCNTIQFLAWWEDTNVTLDKINRWNRDTLFAEGYLTQDNRLTMTMSVSLVGGVTRENVEANFTEWRLLLADFSQSLIR
jgi:hypothetical protein